MPVADAGTEKDDQDDPRLLKRLELGSLKRLEPEVSGSFKAGLRAPSAQIHFSNSSKNNSGNTDNSIKSYSDSRNNCYRYFVA